MEKHNEQTEKNVQVVRDPKQMKSSEKHCCNDEWNKMNFVLGSSVLRNFDETKLDRTQVRSLRGGHVSDSGRGQCHGILGALFLPYDAFVWRKWRLSPSWRGESRINQRLLSECYFSW